MKKVKIAVFCLAIILISIPLSASAVSQQAKYIGLVIWQEKILVNNETKTITHTGSCVAVDIPENSLNNRRLLITANHVVKGTSQAQVEIQEKVFVAQVDKTDPKQDIAYLLVPKEAGTLSATPIAASTFGSYGENKYTLIGYASGTPSPYDNLPQTTLKEISGTIGSCNSYKIDYEIPYKQKETYQVTGIMFSPACEPGMSGGGVFDSKGQLKGIVISQNGRTSVFVPLSKQS